MPRACRPTPTPHTGWQAQSGFRQTQTPASRHARQSTQTLARQRHARGRTQANEGRPQSYRPQGYAPPTPPESCLLPPVCNRESWCAHVREPTWLHAHPRQGMWAGIAERVPASDECACPQVCLHQLDPQACTQCNRGVYIMSAGLGATHDTVRAVPATSISPRPFARRRVRERALRPCPAGASGDSTRAPARRLAAPTTRGRHSPLEAAVALPRPP